MDPDNPKPNVKRPEVFKKINTENLLLIERGLLGDIPEKLKPHSQVQFRTRPNDLPFPKPANIYAAHLNDVDKPTLASPDLEIVTPLEEESPLKKTFSFKEKFFRKSLFGKEKHEKNKSKQNDTIMIEKVEVERRSSSKSNKEKDHDQKSKKFWKRKSKEDKEKKNNNKPLYTRSKSFEFLPKAVDEAEKVDTKDMNLIKNRHSFIYSSNGSLDDTNHLYDEYAIDECPEDSIRENRKAQYYIGNKQLPRKLSSNEASSLSTVNSTNSGSQMENPLLTASFIDLCDKFDKVVEYFNENYASDCETYTKSVNEKKCKLKRDKRKSSSFSSLPSPKVIHLNSVKVSEMSDDFKKELSDVISNRKSGVVMPGNCRSERRGSVTDWFVLEEFAKKSSENIKSVSDNNKYRRAQKKPVNRVRRISSTKYVST